MSIEILISKHVLLKSKTMEERAPKTRSLYQKDKDKIIFSQAFRRLAKKTQVHPLSSNDHIHNRMIHSIEVSCVGRSLGYLIGNTNLFGQGVKADDIACMVESACLAHDIGNPPFGHAGEYAINSWLEKNQEKFRAFDIVGEELSDLLLFEGNAQGFRLLTNAEYNYENDGMRLSLSTLGAFQKYPWTSRNANTNWMNKKGKFGCYLSEKDRMDLVFKHFNIPDSNGSYFRHPLVYLTEAADDICYALLDLEDGLDLGLISEKEVEGILFPLLIEKDKKEYQRIKKSDAGLGIVFLRGKLFDKIIEAAANTFIKNKSKIFSNKFDTGLLDKCIDKKVQTCIEKAKTLARKKVFNSRKKILLEIGAYDTLSVILDTISSAIMEWYNKDCSEKRISFKTKRLFDMLGTYRPMKSDTKYMAMRKMLDYISGMTDNFTIQIAKYFSASGAGD